MKLSKFSKSFQQAVMAVLLPSFAMVGGPVRANPAGPSGADIDAGNVAVQGLGTATVDINNFSQHAIVNWESFSIQQGELARFNQGANAAVLNRVITNNPTEIYGRLEASQGNVFLLNPNGILVGAGGVVDVAGMMTVSTLDVDDADFRNGGDLRFSGSTNTGVTNFGTISSTNGDVVLMGGFVDNKSGGQIGALNGTVAIGSGGDIILHEGGGTRISVRGASDYEGTGIDNQGEVRGASVEMQAHGNVYALAINNGSAVRATGANRSNGRVRLTASGGSSNINLGQSSQIVARAGMEGGDVEVKSVGGAVAMAGEIDARGTTLGGNVSVAGTAVTQAAGSVVNASGAQAAGKVAIDAEDTVTLAGAILAEGVHGSGGEVTVTANRIVINDGADLSADGATTGGLLRVGGDFQGRDTGLREADSLRVEAGAKLSADSLDGDAGTVIAWSNHDTIFVGEVSASARGAVGNGGMVEVSGKEYLYFDGTASVHSIGGKVGTVLFDPGDLIVGAALGIPITSPTVGSLPSSLVSITSINTALQNGANVLLITDEGNIFFNPVAGGGNQDGTTGANDRNSSIQWTNSRSSFGAFASGVIAVNNHIRTSGAGSINLLAGWTGVEEDFTNGVLGAPQFDLSAPGSVQNIWDHYVESGAFGNAGGSISVGSTGMSQHVEVGSRFGDTNLAGFEIRVQGTNNNQQARYAQIGFHDGGQVFAVRLDRGDGVILDLTDSNGLMYLSDGTNTRGEAARGVGDPIAAVAGENEVDIDGGGVDGVNGINSSGVLGDTFIPYATHYNSASSGNWWWQRIDAEIADPLGLGGLRPEHGAGIGLNSDVAEAAILASGLDRNLFELNSADINVIARSNVILQTGIDGTGTGAMIGHGGYNYNSASNNSFRDTGATIQNNTVERRWSLNGSDHDRNSTAIGRLAPVYGNINVIAGVNPIGVDVDRDLGTVTAAITSGGNVNLIGAQIFGGAGSAQLSPAQIGHGGYGQFGEFNGDISVRAGGSINLLAGEGNRSYATIGHTVGGNAYWNPTSQADQQLRFFATVSDFDNPNLRRGELFTGIVTTGFDPDLDPAKEHRITLAQYTQVGTPGSANTVITPIAGTGNYIPRVVAGEIVAGQWINVINGHLITTDPLTYATGINGPSTTFTDNATPRTAMNSLAPLTLAPSGPVKVEALDGSLITGFHGNITVEANTGSIRLEAFMTEGIIGSGARDRRFAQIGHGGTNFAYGSQGAGYQRMLTVPVTPININNSASAPATYDGLERIQYHVAGTDGTTSGSRSEYGNNALNNEASNNRSMVFTSITGDIDVSSGGSIDMIAGNDIYDFTQIGHGGSELADYETSSFILGDIRVHAGGDLNVIGGGGVQPVNRFSTNLADTGTNNYDLRAWSQIGHGGYQSGFLGFIGDIEVNAGGNILVQDGAHSFSYAKIGHQGIADYGQSGGSYIRDENFLADLHSTDIAANLTANTAQVTYTERAHPKATVDTLPVGELTEGVSGSRNFTASGAGTLLDEIADPLNPEENRNSRNTANIDVTAGGAITLEHMELGERQPLARLEFLVAANPTVDLGGGPTDIRNLANFNAQSLTVGIRNRNSYSQIGHGGINTDELFNSSNRAANYGDKTGNITIDALGGDVTLTNGEGYQRWTRIGHGVGQSNAASDPANVGFSRAIELSGNIDVSARDNIYINASHAPDDERAKPGNVNNANGAANASQFNPVAIGHGGVDNNNEVVVLGQGEGVNGLTATSDITVFAGGNMEILGGNGVDASSAQLGHGQRSSTGGNVSRRLGIPTGFSGDIDVRVLGNLLIQGGSNAWTESPFAQGNVAQSVHGAFAAIGHGGYMLDAPSFGEITVYVEKNLDIIAQIRTDERTTTTGSAYNIKNLQVGSDAVASAFNFAKIGHFAVENGDRSFGTGNVPTFSDEVNNASQTGDITVVVGDNLRMQGGTINVDPFAFEVDDDALSNFDTHTIYGAFVQIGHGGPAIGGDLTGDVTVLVSGNIDVSQGAFGIPGVNTIEFDPDDPDGPDGPLGPGPLPPIASIPMNNYAMIGNGDYLNGTRPVPNASDLFRRHAQGFRIGDIVVAAGESASFDGALIGHADPKFGSAIQFTFGNTDVAVSRSNPFFGGLGNLFASNGTVFSSGGYGTSGTMKFYAPSRENNFIGSSTRVNEASEGFLVAPGNFFPDNDPDNFLDPFNPADEELAGRDDEVYLTPDLWWDDLGVAAGFPGGGVFPTAAETGVQGGAIALVDSPGGLPNLTALVAGGLGTSADIYRDGNGVSGAGFYTLYYDAFELVTLTPPTPPAPPFTGTIPGDFENFDRPESNFEDGLGGEGGSLFPGLGLFEFDESNQERGGVSRFEDALDNAFGSSQDSTSEEEDDEERERRRRRAAEAVGPIGLTFYIYEPGTNQLSSYRTFGFPSVTLPPPN